MKAYDVRWELLNARHRLSTVEQCDILFRLEQGRLVQSGSFDEVVKR